MAGLDNGVLWTAAGLDAIHTAYRGAGGYMAGFANLGSTSTPNTGSGMRRLVGAQTMPYAIPEAVTKAILGDDSQIDTFQFGNADVQKGILETGVNDGAFDMAADGISKLTVGIYDFFGLGDTIGNPALFMFLLTRQAHLSPDGTPGWENEMVLSSRVKAIGDEARGHQKEGKARWDCAFNNSNVTPWKQTNQAAFGIPMRRSIRFTSTYRSMFHIWISDGVATTTTPLDYAPVDAPSTKAWQIDTAAPVTVSSVSVGGKTVTFSAVVTPTGTPVVILYQTPSFG